MVMKKLLILDMDETLLHTECFRDIDYLEEGSYDFKFPLGGGGWSNDEHWYFTIKRPFLDEFMNYAFDNFKVAIWTAGGSDYASEAISRSGIDKNKLEFFWARERCTMKYDFETGFRYGVKNLEKVHKSLGWDLNNVLIVDDVQKTAINNYGNLIHIKEFCNDRSDIELKKLMNYLDKIKDSNNFRSIEKRGWSN
jgi:RNA polymerase II subunit A small phosphatase-like protein